MDDVCRELETKIADLKAQRDAAAAPFDADIATLKKALEVLARRNPTGAATGEKPLPEPVTYKRVPSGVTEAAVQIISEGALWHQIPQIIDELRTRGIEVGGSKPERNLASMLSRQKRELGLVAKNRQGWALRSRVEASGDLLGGGDALDVDEGESQDIDQII